MKWKSPEMLAVNHVDAGEVTRLELVDIVIKVKPWPRFCPEWLVKVVLKQGEPLNHGKYDS